MSRFPSLTSQDVLHRHALYLIIRMVCYDDGLGAGRSLLALKTTDASNKEYSLWVYQCSSLVRFPAASLGPIHRGWVEPEEPASVLRGWRRGSPGPADARRSAGCPDLLCMVSWARISTHLCSYLKGRAAPSGCHCRPQRPGSYTLPAGASPRGSAGGGPGDVVTSPPKAVGVQLGGEVLRAAHLRICGPR